MFPVEENFTLKEYLFQRNKDPELFEKFFEIPITEPMNINGAATIKIFYKTVVPEVPVHVNFVILDHNDTFVARGWRTGFITDTVNQVGSAELTSQLVKATLQPGAKIYLIVRTKKERVFLRQPQSKWNLTGSKGDSIEFLSGPGHQTQLELPVEKDLNSHMVEIGQAI